MDTALHTPQGVQPVALHNNDQHKEKRHKAKRDPVL